MSSCAVKINKNMSSCAVKINIKKMHYNESRQAWSNILLKNKIIEEFPALKEKHSYFQSPNGSRQHLKTQATTHIQQ